MARNWNADESLSVAGTSTPLTAATYGDSEFATIVVEVAAVRFYPTGTAPTAALGIPLNVGDTLKLENSAEVRAARFIRQGAVSATLQVIYGD